MASIGYTRTDAYLSPEDIEDIHNLFRQLSDNEPPEKEAFQFMALSGFRTVLARQLLTFYGGGARSQIVGFGCLQINCLERSGFISNMIVDENQRGQGIAWNILAILEREAELAGIQSIYLHTNSHNPKRAAAIRMYEKFGFELVARGVKKEDSDWYRLTLS